MYLAMGNDAMSYALMQNDNEPIEYHAMMLKAFAKRRPYWQKLIDLNKNTKHSGITIAHSKERYKMKLSESQPPFLWQSEPWGAAGESWRITGIPMCYKKGNEGVVMLPPDVVDGMSDAEIMDLIAKPVITDGKTIVFLYEKGFGKYLNVSVKEKPRGIFQEKFVKHTVNSHVKGGGEWATSSFVCANAYQYEVFGDNIEPVSKYITKRPNIEKTGEEPFPYGIASAIVTTEKGGRWAVMGEYPWSGFLSFDKRNQFINIANYLSANAVAVILETPVQAVVMPRENADGEITSVSVLNKTVGDSGEIFLRIKKPKGEKFKFMTFKDDKVIETQVEGIKDNGDLVLKIPNISGWGIGTVYSV